MFKYCERGREGACNVRTVGGCTTSLGSGSVVCTELQPWWRRWAALLCSEVQLPQMGFVSVSSRRGIAFWRV